METYIRCNSECKAERIYPKEGEDLDWRAETRPFCEEEGHVCSHCLGEFLNLYGDNRDETIRAYQAWRANPSRESLAEYKILAHHRRRLRHTKKAQFEETTAILDEFVGNGGGKSCARLAPWACGLSKDSAMVPINIPHGEFIGDGYLCQSCSDGD